MKNTVRRLEIIIIDDHSFFSGFCLPDKVVSYSPLDYLTSLVGLLSLGGRTTENTVIKTNSTIAGMYHSLLSSLMQ